MSTNVTPAVLIAWDGETFDDVTNDVRAEPGISITRGKDSARPRAQPMVPSADVTLNNQDHRYTSENAGSDIYPYVIPDRPISIGVGQGSDLDYETNIDYDADIYYNGVGTLTLFTGLTDEPEESLGMPERHVMLRSLGSMTKLRGLKLSTTLSNNIDTGYAVGLVLNYAGWPADARVIATGDTFLNWWWLDEQDAFDALVDLLETEGAGASLYEDGQGRIHFENRNYRASTTRCTTSQATFGADASRTLGMTSFQYSQGMRDVYNDVSMTIKERPLITNYEVWTKGDTWTLGGGESQSFIVKSTVPMDAVYDPVVTTDYTLTSGSLTTYTATLVTATSFRIDITAGGGGAVLDAPSGGTAGPRIRGTGLRDVQERTVTQTASTSTLLSRARSLNLVEAGARQEISAPYAQTLVDAAATYYRDGRPAVSFEIANRDQARIDQMLQREISDRITVQAGPNEFSGECWIEQITHNVTIGGRIVRCGIVASRALGTGGTYVENPGLWDAGLWDTALWGV